MDVNSLPCTSVVKSAVEHLKLVAVLYFLYCFILSTEKFLKLGQEIARLVNVAIKTKIYGVLYNRCSSFAFDETSSYWSAPKSS